MKYFFKVIAGIFLCLLLLIIICIGKDSIQSRSYSGAVAAGETIKKDDHQLLTTTFALKDDEHVILLFSKVNSLLDGGGVLTNQRLLSILKGQTLETCNCTELADIASITIDSTKNFANGSLIRVTMKDSTKFSFSVPQMQHGDMIFYDKLKTEISRVGK